MMGLKKFHAIIFIAVLFTVTIQKPTVDDVTCIADGDRGCDVDSDCCSEICDDGERCLSVEHFMYLLGQLLYNVTRD